MDGMLEYSCDEIAVGLKKSTIEHDSAEIGCFVIVLFEKVIVVAYHTGKRMYASLYSDNCLDRRYGEGLIYVGVK